MWTLNQQYCSQTRLEGPSTPNHRDKCCLPYSSQEQRNEWEGSPMNNQCAGKATVK